MSNLVNNQDNEPIMIAQPFKLQAGGHSMILKYDEITVCKLLKPKEKVFYENKPNELDGFLPEYVGIIKVMEFEEDNGGKKLFVFNTSDLLLKPHIQPIFLNDSKKKEIIEAYNQFINKKQKNEVHYLVLKDLVSHYKYPCIIDIKIGTRQYDDTTSEEDKIKFIEQCAKTTSKDLGAKIHGVYITQSTNPNDITKFGRETGNRLTIDELKHYLNLFLINDNRFRLDVVDAIIDKIKKLRERILLLTTYRIYDSSLLISYNAEFQNKYSSHNNSNNNNCNDITTITNRVNSSKTKYTNTNNCSNSNSPVSLYMVDFAHYMRSQPDEGPDEGYLFGLDSLLKIFNEIRSKYTTNNNSNNTQT